MLESEPDGDNDVDGDCERDTVGDVECDDEPDGDDDTDTVDESVARLGLAVRVSVGDADCVGETDGLALTVMEREFVTVTEFDAHTVLDRDRRALAVCVAQVDELTDGLREREPPADALGEPDAEHDRVPFADALGERETLVDPESVARADRVPHPLALGERDSRGLCDDESDAVGVPEGDGEREGKTFEGDEREDALAVVDVLRLRVGEPVRDSVTLADGERDIDVHADCDGECDGERVIKGLADGERDAAADAVEVADGVGWPPPRGVRSRKRSAAARIAPGEGAGLMQTLARRLTKPPCRPSGSRLERPARAAAVEQPLRRRVIQHQMLRAALLCGAALRSGAASAAAPPEVAPPELAAAPPDATAPRRAEAPSCAPPTLDAPSVMRNGGDYRAAPLAAGAPLAACVALCCAEAEAGCIAFSYNNPQPLRSGACAAGGVCCMLKNGNGTLAPNPWPHNVTTGAMARAPPPPPQPGPAPPFPPSPLLSGAAWGAPRHWGSDGDTWPSAWAADGALYAWPCDNAAGPMSLWRVDGDPAAGAGLSAAEVSTRKGGPLDYAALCGSLGPTGAFPNINIKPGGMVALPPSAGAANGTLVVGVSCMNYGDDVAFNRQHNLAGFVAESADNGATWRNVTAVGGPFVGRFAAPVFVSCGQANAPCAAKDGDILYVFFPGADDNQAYWDNNDAIFLARVPTAARAAPAEYEYYSGLDGAGAPTWTLDQSQAQPTVYYGNMIGENPISYHPQLQRYLIANFGFIDAAGRPRPWHQKPYMSPHRTQLILLEAREPWGPWSIFYRSDDSASLSPAAPGLYAPSFPSKFMSGVGADGRVELWMVFACLDFGTASGCLYTLNWVNLSVAVNASAL